MYPLNMECGVIGDLIIIIIIIIIINALQIGHKTDEGENK